VLVASRRAVTEQLVAFVTLVARRGVVVRAAGCHAAVLGRPRLPANHHCNTQSVSKKI
jgi:hypothetical protein